jgi:dipeptidyl aminopeptidase/acylaminoacyl peptidase
MSEYTTLFEEASTRIDIPSLPMEGMLRRRDRKRRNQRIAAGAVGLAIGIALMALGSVVLRSAREPQPADWPLPSRTTVPLFHKGEVVKRPLDRQTLVATDISTGAERTIVRCQSDCAAIQDFDGSADGGWVAYDVLTCGGDCAPVEPEAGLWIAGAKGPPRHVSTGGWVNTWSWSPSGAQLAYANGSELTLLDPTTWERTRIATAEGFIAAIGWGPDGRSIAYSVEPPSEDTQPASSLGIFVVRSGGEPQSVSATLGTYGIAWSPDGTSLLLDSNDEVRNWMAVVGTDGSGERVLVKGPSFEGPGMPVWSPDGRSIAYVRTPGKSGDIEVEFWVIGAEGRRRVRIGRFGCCPHPWDGPVWSPDSQLVAFSDDTTRWVVARADGVGTPKPIDRLEVEGWRQG